MNPEFDLLLTAYLDGELEPEPCLRVESAMRGDPAAAERLAALGRVRDLVATLRPPDPAPDVSGDVVALIGSRRRASFRTARNAAVILTGLAAAAALLLMLGGPPDRPRGGPMIADAPRPVKPSRPRPPAPRLATLPRPLPPSPALDAAIREDTLAAEIRDRDDRAGLDDLLHRDGVRVVDLVLDEMGPASLGAVDDVVRTTSRVRPNHAKVEIRQGVVVDPSRPGKACVYVMVMDEHEYARFRKGVDDRFPDALSVPAPVPKETLASLSKVGRVRFFRDTLPAGTLKRPPADLIPELAIRAPKREAADEVFITPRGVTVRPKASTVVPAPDDPARKTELPVDLQDSPRLVYLVWVSSRNVPRG